MGLLMARNSRFSRTITPMMPEYRFTSPRGRKTRVSVVVPATHNRRPDQKGKGSDDRS